jgi:hypothetical protein
VQVQPTSPFHGRLQGGEQLLQVDDVRIAAKTGDEVGALLRGAPGSEVRLYVRGGKGPGAAAEGARQDVQGGVDDASLFATNMEPPGKQTPLSSAAPGGPLPPGEQAAVSSEQGQGQVDMASAYLPPPAYPKKDGGCAIQ